MSKANGTAKPKAASKRMPWTTKDGERLRKARKGFDLSQAQLGEMVGVTGSRISECETVDYPGCGRHCSPGRELSEKIAAAFEKLAAKAKAAKTRMDAKASKAETPKAEAPKPPVEAEAEEPVGVGAE